MRTRLCQIAVMLLFMCITANGKPMPSEPKDEPTIAVYWCGMGPVENHKTCICMDDDENRMYRRICHSDLDPGNCWDDTGWFSGGNVLPHNRNDELPTAFDSKGNLFIAVGANQGGNFSVPSAGTCLPFTPNSTGVIMLPAALVR